MGCCHGWRRRLEIIRQVHRSWILKLRVYISWDEGYPNSTEDQHAEGDTLCLIEDICTPNHFRVPPPPGLEALNTARTTMVFTRIHETQSTKLIPKAACLN
ncbi:unnamed protein product [Boreogadus saida]